MPDQPAHLDRAHGLAACGGNRDLHAQVAELLAADLPERLGALRRALQAGDLVNAGRMAHKHKGACLAVGALALAEAFAAVNAAARAGDRALAESSYALLKPLMDAFVAAVAD